MTAYLTLKRYPLSRAQNGFTITITANQAREEAQDTAENQSDVTVAAREQLTERQLLEALLIPSGSHIAQMLAAEVAGSETSFVAEMNAEARALGMDHTIYTDPSGFDPSTVSTAADQLLVFEQAMRLLVFRQIVSMPSVTLPVVCTLTNFNPPIAKGYAGKTGSNSAAGGCLAFFTDLTIGGRQPTVAGVVPGAGAGEQHVRAPRRRGPDRPAAGRLRRPGPRAHDRCTRRGRRRRGRRSQPWPPAATRYQCPPGAELMSTQSLQQENT